VKDKLRKLLEDILKMLSDHPDVFNVQPVEVIPRFDPRYAVGSLIPNIVAYRGTGVVIEFWFDEERLRR